MNPSQFNKRITICRSVLTRMELSQKKETFEDVFRVWAMVKTLRGNEYIAAAQVKAENTTRFVVRYSRAIEELTDEQKTRFAIRYKEKMYDVKSIINDDEMNKTFTIITEGRM